MDNLIMAKQQILEEYDSSPTATTNVDEFVTASPHNILVDWLPQRDPQVVQILNFLNANGLLPLRCLYISYLLAMEINQFLLFNQII